MRFITHTIISLCLLLWAGMSWAVEVSNLNAADVPVANRSPAALKQGLQKAFQQVLIKMSGNPGVATLPAIENAQQQVTNWVQSYSFHSEQDLAGKLVLYLRASFDQQGLKRLLKQSGQPVWSSDRPLTLIWLTLQGQNPSYVLSSDSSNPLQKLLTRDAFQRGIAIILPAMDLQDQSYINTSDKSFSRKQLTLAAKRYGVHSVLAGNARLGLDGQWYGQWLLLLNGEPYRWSNNNTDLSLLLANAMKQMANLMANQLAIADSASSIAPVLLQIAGINTLQDYVRVTKLLQNLPPVTRVEVADMSQHGLLLRLQTEGGEQELANALAGVWQLQKQLVSADTSGEQASLYYRWRVR